MSGICAVWRKQDPERTAGTLASVSGGLSPAGAEPIEVATAAGAGVGISCRFRSQQIYQNPRILIACDADLYNEDELGVAAGDSGPVPANARTAALLAALYDRSGTAFVDQLRGAFSVIVWDQRERKLVAAVDGFGIHRLVYYEDSRVLLVASRIDALMESGSIEREINPRAIVNVLNFGASLAPETIMTTVRRVLPGTMLVATEGASRSNKYWDMRYDVETDLNEAQLSRKLEAVVEEAVAAQYKTDPTAAGAFLSGGTDSSTVVGMMARAGCGEVQAYSIGFQEQPFNELHYAQIAAKRFRAQHHTYLVGAEDCLTALPQMVRCFDEPFGNSSAIPTYFCARLAAQHGTKVLLAGDGGDELFGGNEWYGSDKIFGMYQSVPAVLRKGLIEPVLKMLPLTGGVVRKGRNYVRRANLPGIERVMSYHFLCAHDPSEILEGDFLEQALGGYSVLDVPNRYYAQGPGRDHLDRMLYTDVKTILGDSDLPKVTRMSELAGIQARFPFLARPVAEFSGCIPARLKVKGFQKRYLFKRAFRDLLPAEIIQKKKHGFGIPVATWLKSDARMRELSRDTLLSSRAFERGYFRRDFIEGLFQKHESDNSTYYGDTLWTFLVLELWHRQFVDEPARVIA